MATQVSLNSGAIASAGALAIQTNGTTQAVSISTGQVATLAKDAVIQGVTVGRGAGAVASNTAVGASALVANTSGQYNSAVGYRALYTNATGGFATAMGYNALSLSTGDGNSAFGFQAGLNTSTGIQNTYIGTQSGNGNTTGQENTSLGSGSLVSGTTGSYNTAVGRSALEANTTASYNTAVGYQAGYSSTIGERNVMLGRAAGYSNTGSFNTLLGDQAGYSLTTGTNNVFVGPSNAGYSMTTGSKNTIIGGFSGNGGGLDIRTASNYIVLSDGDGSPRGGWDSSAFFHSGEWAHSDGSMFYAASNTTLNCWRGSTTANEGVFGVFSNIGGTKTVRAFFRADGGLANYSGNDVNLSDERLKKDIALAGNYLDKICAIPVKNFRYKDQSASEDITLGVIAQDVLAVAPELVSNDGFGVNDENQQDYLSIYQTDMQYALMKCIQELKAEVDSLKAQINGASA
jgi:hypothetical protein